MARRRPALKLTSPSIQGRLRRARAELATLAPDPITNKELGALAGNVWAAVRVLEEGRLVAHICAFGDRAADEANEDTARYMLAVATLTATGKRRYELVGDAWGGVMARARAAQWATFFYLTDRKAAA
jgi:hypothetical protein